MELYGIAAQGPSLMWALLERDWPGLLEIPTAEESSFEVRHYVHF